MVKKTPLTYHELKIILKNVEEIFCQWIEYKLQNKIFFYIYDLRLRHKTRNRKHKCFDARSISNMYVTFHWIGRLVRKHTVVGGRGLDPCRHQRNFSLVGPQRCYPSFRSDVRPQILCLCDVRHVKGLHPTIK